MSYYYVLFLMDVRCGSLLEHPQSIVVVELLVVQVLEVEHVIEVFLGCKMDEKAGLSIYKKIFVSQNQVKRRLDYQTETTNVLRRTEQKHMVDWIISNVRQNPLKKILKKKFVVHNPSI